MWISIVKFSAVYNPGVNKGEIRLFFQNGQFWTYPIDSPAEFAAVMAILSQPSAIFNTATKEIGVGISPTG